MKKTSTHFMILLNCYVKFRNIILLLDLALILNSMLFISNLKNIF
jgi:hypothetical protein